jgi:hypothetical protein
MNVFYLDWPILICIATARKLAPGSCLSFTTSLGFVAMCCLILSQIRMVSASLEPRVFTIDASQAIAFALNNLPRPCLLRCYPLYHSFGASMNLYGWANSVYRVAPRSLVCERPWRSVSPRSSYCQHCCVYGLNYLQARV